MSVIAWDGKTLAADKRASLNACSWPVTKIHKVGPDALACISGNSDQGGEMLAWYIAGAEPSAFPPSQRADGWSPLVVIRRDGAVLRYEQTPYPVKFEAEMYADGSGMAYAIAAMECGKTAAEAVAIACKYDPACGNGIDVLTFDVIGG